MRRILFVIMVVCFVLISQNVPAQEKIAAQVIYSGDDPVGARLAYQVKEGIRRSAGLRLSNINEAKAMIHLVTVDYDLKMPGLATIYGFTITSPNVGGEEIFLKSGVGTCGAHRVNEFAEGLVAHLDQAADDVRGNLSK